MEVAHFDDMQPTVCDASLSNYMCTQRCHGACTLHSMSKACGPSSNQYMRRTARCTTHVQCLPESSLSLCEGLQCFAEAKNALFRRAQDQNWVETNDCAGTYLAGPAAPVWHAFGMSENERMQSKGHSHKLDDHDFCESACEGVCALQEQVHLAQHSSCTANRARVRR